VERWAAWLARFIRWPRRRVSGRRRPRGTPMRHLSPRLAAREVLLLPSLVVGPPGLALLVLRAGPLYPLPTGLWRAGSAVDVAPITPAADAHRLPASRAPEHPRLGRRHRPAGPRALQIPPRTRFSIRLSGPSRHCSRLTRRPGMSPRASTLRPLLCLPHLPVPRQSAALHLRWVTPDEHTPGVFAERLSRPCGAPERAS